ncbi:RNase H domain-containing protein [Trichonephila clavipes]|nr:RNase H domain-containing protein [Trichonephila clavipes]
MDLLDQDIEEHFLKNVFNPREGLPRVHFKPEMGAHTSKNQDPPEYLRQLALEIINKIPATAMQIYTDGSKDEQNSCGSGIFIKAPNCSHNIKIRNSDFCSVFRSELIAIDEALRIIKTMTSPDEIWILCDSRSAIQHLSDWTNVGDKTSVSILKNLKELSQQHEIYFQWIPSHIGLFGNDTADLLAKEELWKTPPTHPWYNRQAPGGALSIKADRVVQTTISRLASGHIRGLSFNLGQKIYENCTKCNLVQATPDHLLFCAGLEREDIYSSPLLVLHWCAKIKDEVEKLAYQLNEEAERTERPIRRSSNVMYGSTCADMQVDVMGECLSSIKHVVGARRNRRQTVGEIARHTTQATGRPISRFTVARRLHGGGLFARRPVRCVPLTPAHRRRRSLWCREHRNWRDNEWGRVLFTDESRFSLSSDSHRILFWRERGSRNHPSNIIERDRYGGRGVLRRYGSAVPLHHAPCHRTVAAEQLLESEDIERMDWPARSPDLNPIEHVWDFLGRRLAARTLPPVTIRELRLVLQDE